MQISYAKESEMLRLQHFAAISLQNLPLFSPGEKIRAHNLRYVVEVECVLLKHAQVRWYHGTLFVLSIRNEKGFFIIGDYGGRNQ